MGFLPWQRLAATALLVLGATQTLGQEYPSKPIRLVVGYPPGGIMDIYARALATPLQQRLKSAVLVENRPGAGGLVGAAFVAKSPPDGYTLIHIAPTNVSRVFIKNPPLELHKDLQPIASVWIAPFVLAINGQLPAGTLKEFIDYAKANPGKLNFGSTNAINYLPMMLFASVAGTQIQPIEYKGATQMNTALMTGEIQVTFSTIQAIVGLLESGKLRVLAVTGDQRLPLIPNVPTTTEAGYPALQAYTIGAVMGPAGLPEAVSAKLSPLLRDIVLSPDMAKLLNGNGRPLAVAPEELMRLVREEEAIWEKAAKIAGYKPQ